MEKGVESEQGNEGAFQGEWFTVKTLPLLSC